jgi:hypothetical protein
MKQSKSKFGLRSANVILLAAAAGANASAQDSLSWIPAKPAWLTDASVGVKETYDDNIFLSGVDAKYLPKTYTVPPGSVAALENMSSWITTVSPRVAVDFSPLLGSQSNVQTLSLAYAPDFVTYHDASSESYDAQRAISALKAKWGAFSVSLDNAFTYVDGSSTGPFYPGNLFNADMNSVVRERREQIQDKAAIALQYDWDQFFFRPVASLTYYDLMTTLYDASGYQNYASRYDVNGGADIGYRVCPDVAFTLGYRYGHQYQQQFSFSPYSSPSDYQRVLVGMEGHPWKWLTVRISGGPDFRVYPGDTADHITPVNDHHPIKPYGEASLIAALTGKDTITFKFKEWQWVSSIGKVPYLETTYDLNYHRKVTEKLGFDLGGKILSSDYTSGNLSTCVRNDWDYQAIAGVGYAFNSHVSVNLAYTLELGDNMADDVVNPDTRSYIRNVVSLGAVFKF